MHIALNGWFWDQVNVGSGQYLRYLLGSLRRVSPETRFTLVLPSRIQQPADVPAGVEVVTVKAFGGNVGKVWFEQRAFPAAAGRVKADIAHVPYWAPPLASPVPLVVSILDVVALMIPDYSYGFAARLYTSLVSAGAQGANHVITLTQASKNDIIQQLGLPAENITPTHLAVDDAYHPRMGAERDKAVREKYQLPDDYIFYIGGFDVRKQVNQLLLAYTYVAQAEGDDYPLVIAGREPQWGTRMFPDMRRYAEELNISRHIHWLGYVDEADKPSLYRMAKLFVSPTLYEGFGLPVLEAMASGTPVVANDIASIAEIVGDGAYLTETGSARQMAGAMIALLEQKPLRDTLINQGLAQATRFSWRKTALETLKVYEKVLNHGT
ncbi:MAG: glycosyltransferase family 1 protein [Anaerolineae bacterium]